MIKEEKMAKKRERGKVVYIENINPKLYERMKELMNENNKKITKELAIIFNKAMQEEIDRYEEPPLSIYSEEE